MPNFTESTPLYMTGRYYFLPSKRIGRVTIPSSLALSAISRGDAVRGKGLTGNWAVESHTSPCSMELLGTGARPVAERLCRTEYQQLKRKSTSTRKFHPSRELLVSAEDRTEAVHDRLRRFGVEACLTILRGTEPGWNSSTTYLSKVAGPKCSGVTPP